MKKRLLETFVFLAALAVSMFIGFRAGRANQESREAAAKPARVDTQIPAKVPVICQCTLEWVGTYLVCKETGEIKGEVERDGHAWRIADFLCSAPPYGWYWHPVKIRESGRYVEREVAKAALLKSMSGDCVVAVDAGHATETTTGVSATGAGTVTR